jgi:MoaA/NifB/PqqE/SkfB family radical SAM enzyme
MNKNENLKNNQQNNKNQEQYDSKTALSSIEELIQEEFPVGYVNNVAHWGNYSVQEMHQQNEDGTYQLLHLDIDLGNTSSLRCPHCFRRDARLDSEGESGFLNQEELFSYIKDAKELGLKSVKFLGRGEPFENKQFLGFLEQLSEMGVGASVFTKGHVIGDDDLAKKFNSHYGINSGKDLAKKLKELDVSILLGFNSFNQEVQDSYVGLNKSPLVEYTQLRDKALVNLVEAGLNDYVPGKATRLAIISAPIKPENMSEIKEIYTWGRKRNIYALSCPSTISGNGIDETQRVKEHQDYVSNLLSFYTEIYVWNIENNLQTIDQFKEEGVSLYPGNHPCTQTAVGMYLTLSGKVIRCPGRADKQSTFTEDIRSEESLKSVWVNSENYKRASGKIPSPEKNGLNYCCPARDGFSLPNDFYSQIKERVINYF